MIAAGTVWGLSPIFYKIIDHVPPGEVLAYRAASSFVIFAIVLAFQDRLRTMFFQLFASPHSVAGTFVAALLIGSNWFLFVYAVQVGQATQASLGYFIFPLVAVLLGWAVLRERFSAAQWVAVGMTAAAVLFMSSIVGKIPVMALSLATTFALYGLIKKRKSQGAVISVSAESFSLTPFALAWLLGIHALGWTDFTGRDGGWFGRDMFTTFMLASSGLITAGPLILISYGFKRVRYSEGGFLLYTVPTLQFLVAVLLFREPFAAADFMAFLLIWIALAVFTLEASISPILRAVLQRVHRATPSSESDREGRRRRTRNQ